MVDICVKIQKMTGEIMQDLEEKGMIIRLTPSREDYKIDVREGEIVGQKIYASDITAGPHSLHHATINNTVCANFGTHQDNEEFLLLGGVNEKKMLIVIALLTEDELDVKIASTTLVAEDFVCLEAVFNDPELSFFVMKKGIPHGECCYGEGLPATFYVTEGSELTTEKTDFMTYNICPGY